MKIGIEIHQQLATRKLFCDCPSKLSDEEADVKLKRRLRPSQSELGEIDGAALQEFLKGKSYLYQVQGGSSCLVEGDEEPPHMPNEEALDIALGLALKLNARPVDEVHFMRKIVIDGSSPYGFQRTAIVALDGHIDIDGIRVRVPTICLEEEAARKIKGGEKETVYRLDRLGIPLIEVTTAPDITDLRQAKKTALTIGRILREFNVNRGIGTIRQDINISIDGGARVEIKGVQDLNEISNIIEGEVKRQQNLIEVKEEIKKRGSPKINFDIFDVSDVFFKTESKVISGQIGNGGKVLALRLRGFSGLLKGGIGPEFAGYAKTVAGVRGIFHSDELPAYGITQGEVDRVLREINLVNEDAFVLVTETEETARKALSAVFDRAKAAFDGVPEETRMANPDSTTSYMRPLPGAARMYPETDIPPIVISDELLDKVRKNLPESYGDKIKYVLSDGKANEEQATQLVTSSTTIGYGTEKISKFQMYKLFAEKNPDLNRTLLITTLTSTMTSLSRDGVPVENITGEKLAPLFSVANEGKISKEAIPDVLRELAKNPKKTVEELTEEQIGTFGEKEISEIVQKIIKEREAFVKEKGPASIGPLMGPVMEGARGKADGKLVNSILRREIEKFLK